MTTPRTCWHRILLFSTLGLAGCGIGTADKLDGPPKGDVADLTILVSQMPDIVGRPKSFKASFSKDATVPTEADRKRIGKLQFSLVGTPAIKDGTAEVDVAVRNSATGDPAGQVKWTFVKESEQWKLKTAPLP
jgi:hypothetical protein